ncbi:MULTISPECIES: hypothetical protein [Thermomonosporaceae]|uniref:hypothetical protein n=1 Tax=Thermomonosporaceae TaxID=2012 RepID=UPI00255AF096|nr:MULTISPECIES: hypothetical protein [Thermomonosporaceae]
MTPSDMARLAIVLDLESSRTQVIQVRPQFVDPTVTDRPPCRPFGVTWSPEELFIANNRQLLIFDHALNYVRSSTVRLQINIHQLAFGKGRVWAVSPWTNSLIGAPTGAGVEAIEFDLSRNVLVPYRRREGRPSADEHHFNSILWADGHLFVAAHAFGEGSFINRYDAETLRFQKTLHGAGHSIHGLARHEGELFWVSTMTQEIRSDRGYRLFLHRPGYPRGFAMTAEYFVVAISQCRGRGRRHAGNSWIQVIDRRQGRTVHETELRDTGGINDLRLLSEYDYAHRVPPFPLLAFPTAQPSSG